MHFPVPGMGAGSRRNGALIRAIVRFRTAGGRTRYYFREDIVAKSVAGLVLLGLSVMLTGCSSAPLVTVPPDWRYEQGAISLHITADPQLNLFHKTPHALVLCVYSLRDPNAFNQLLDERDGLPKLLECGRFDPTVVHARQMVIQPGEQIDETLDRAEGAKFITIAAGYYNLDRERVTRAWPIPVLEEKRGGTLLQRTKKLAIDLELGADGIGPAKESQ